MLTRFFTIIIISFFAISCNTAEDEAWQAVLAEHSQEAIDSFLIKNPDSKYKNEAAAKKEEFAWYKALQRNTVYEYKKYAADYPNGTFIEEVPVRLDSIQTNNISLIDLTKNAFVGKIDYGNRETQIINFRFAEILQDSGHIKFWATINTSDIRKTLEGRINQEDNSIMFMEDPNSKIMLNLTDGRIYKQNNKLVIESINVSQYWSLIKYDE